MSVQLGVKNEINPCGLQHGLQCLGRLYAGLRVIFSGQRYDGYTYPCRLLLFYQCDQPADFVCIQAGACNVNAFVCLLQILFVNRQIGFTVENCIGSLLFLIWCCNDLIADPPERCLSRQAGIVRCCLYFFGVKSLYTFSILYPMPICVWIYCGESGSDSSFLRSVAIKTRSEATSLSQELPQTSWVI